MKKNKILYTLFLFTSLLGNTLMSQTQPNCSRITFAPDILYTIPASGGTFIYTYTFSPLGCHLVTGTTYANVPDIFDYARTHVTLDDDTFPLTVEENLTSSERSFIVNVYDGSGTQLGGLNLTQEAGTPPPPACNVPSTERAALIDLFNATNGASWTNNTNWNTSAPVCDWFGVTVTNNRVTGINLFNNNLTGSLNSSIENLTALINFTVTQNQLSGTVPASITNLSQLKQLVIAENQFSGNIPNLSTFPFFPVLIFQGNNFVFSNFESEHSTYQSITTVYTYSPQSKVDQEETLSVAENGTITLTSTALTSPNNSYQWFKDGVAISGATNKDYVITSAAPSDAGVYYFEATNSIVTGLTLTRNNITLTIDPPIDTCGVSETEKQALLDLYNNTNGDNWTNTLAGNQPWDTNIPVCDWFGVTVTDGLITGVNLNNTGLSGTLPATLGNLSNLTEIYLIGNNLSGNIPVQLGNLSNLEYLYLYFNNLSGSIPLELGNLSNLKHLYLYSNNLSGGIPSELGNLLNLEFLILSDNQFTGSIPPQLGNLSKLQGLSLDRNQLTGSIPNELGSLLELKALNFNTNMLTGTIPSVLGDLADLELLRVSNNQLTGSIPVEIANLAQLKDFWVSNNPLDGDIPFELAGLTNLNVLEIRNNNFVFTNFEDVHATFQNILSSFNYRYFPQAKVDQEEALSVAENGTITLTSTALTSPNNSYQWYKDGVAITGATSKDYVISSAATTDAGIYYFEATNSIVTGLTLTRNNITLTIDPPIDTCGVSETEKQALLDLYNSTNGDNWTNTLAGNQPWDTNIPVCDWFGVTVVDGKITSINLNGNNLVGQISSSINQLIYLEQLYLRTNQINDIIPLEIAQISNLRDLYLDGNQLTGSIPPEIGQLSNLEDLILTRNNISGNIPSELGQLTNLKILQLGVNNLSGSLPSELEQLFNLTILNISENNLLGTFPNFTNASGLNVLYIDTNNFVFSDFEAEHAAYVTNVSTYNFSPQSKVDQEETLSVAENGTITLTSTALTSPNNSYQWFKDGVAISGATSKDYVITSASPEDAGVYYFEATNSIVTGLTLTRNNITLTIDPPIDTCGVSETEKQALLDLYNSTNGDNWTNTLAGNQPWDTNIPVCNWFGVTVVDDKVTGLDLGDNNLSGNITSTLGILMNLEIIRLRGNNLIGVIPPELGNISNLNVLILESNNLTGFIPSEIGLLQNLVELNLHNNNLSGSIPDSIYNLLNLEKLSFSENNLTGIISSLLGNLSKLKLFIVRSNSFSGQIPIEIIQLNNLEFVSFSENNFSSTIPDFSGISSINIMFFFNNNFVFSDFETEHETYAANITTYSFSPQAKVDQEETLSVAENGTITLTSTALTSTNNSYQWFKDGVAIAGATSKDYVITSAAPSDAGVYYFEATNSIITDLTLTRNNITLEVGPPLCGVSDPERQALLDLYAATNGDNWTNTLAGNQPWDINISVCDWYGVTVEDGKVTNLQLPNNDLNGVLPENMGSLLHIKNIDLSNNQITGDIPVSMGSLLELETLNIANNNITGELPPALGSLSNLVLLDLSNNAINSQIPISFCNLGKVTNLDLSFNNLNGSIPREIELMRSLVRLNLSNNNLSGAIPPSLSSLSNLEELQVQNNQLSKNIPFTLNVNSRLEHFTFENNKFIFFNFQGKHVAYQQYLNTAYNYAPQAKTDTEQTLTVSLGNAITLTTELSDTNNSYQWYKDGEEIPGATNRELVIENATEEDEAEYYFIATNSVIDGLELTRNTITLNLLTTTSCEVPLAERQALIALYNATNGANWTNTQQNQQVWGINDSNSKVCDWFGVTIANNTITEINLPNNTLEGTILPETFDAFASLEVINLSSNKLSGVIDDVFVNNENLRVLWIQNNEFIFSDLITDFTTIMQTLAYDFRFSPQAKVGIAETVTVDQGASYTLTNNSLTSTENIYQWYKNGIPIPEATSKDFVLNDISASDGAGYHFTATNSIVNGLTLEGEMITIKIDTNSDPCGVSDFERETLIAFYNTMDGPNWTNNTNWNTNEAVCNWYGVMVDENANVIGLNLGNNNLRGEIPSELAQIAGLTQINFSQNNVIGQIPSTLGQLTALEVLLLNDNILVGEIPQDITAATSLVTFNINNNRIAGVIPGSIGNLSQLQYFDASDNKLTGTLPEGIYTIPSLKRINVSRNNLGSGISENIGNLIQLEEFWLAENNFSGTIPQTITNIPGLRSVRINNNRFGGDIPLLIPNFNLSNTQIAIENNEFVFSDFESEYPDYSTQVDIFTYDPQAKVDIGESIPVLAGESITLGTVDLTSPNNSYVWYKDDVVIANATESSYTIENFDPIADVGRYYFIATNSTIANLELERNPIILSERIIPPLDDLTLTALCSNNPSLTREWQITNPNAVNVPITWEVLNTSQTGTLDASPGNNLFTTNTEIGNNAVRITWVIQDGSNQSTEKISTTANCNPQTNCIDYIEGIADGSFESAFDEVTGMRNGTFGPSSGWTFTEGTPDTLDPNTATNEDDYYFNTTFSNSPNGGICAGALREGSTSESFETNVTGLTVGVTYVVQFFQANASNIEESDLIPQTYGFWEVSFGNETQNSEQIAANLYRAEWIGQSIEFVAESTSQNLNFKVESTPLDSTDAYPVYMLIDGIHVFEKVTDASILPCSEINTQVFCNIEEDSEPTISDLSSPLSTNTVWYDEQFGGNAYDPSLQLSEISFPYLWADDGSGAARIPVKFVLNLGVPDNLLFQSFSSSSNATLSDIDLMENTVVWYDSYTSTTPLVASTILVHEGIYYAERVDNPSCRLPIEVEILDMPEVFGDSYQEFCSSNNPTIADLVMQTTSPSNTLLWYSDSIGGTLYNSNDPLVSGTTYYVVQTDGTNTSEYRIPVDVSIIDVASQSRRYNRDVDVPENTPVSELSNLFDFDESTVWYNQASGGTAYINSSYLSDGETYYARTGEGICAALEVLAVTITVSDVEVPELVTCIKFIPQPGDKYVISGWVRQDALVSELIGNKDFNTDSEAKDAMIKLLEAISKRIKDQKEIPNESFVAKSIFEELNLDPLVPYIKNFNEQNVTIHDFKLEKELVEGVEKFIGYSFSLSTENSTRIMYKTPEVQKQYLRGRRTNNLGYHFPILNYDEDFIIDYTDVSVTSNDEFRITSNFNVTTLSPRVIQSYENETFDSETASAISETIELFSYSTDPTYQALNYDSAEIDLSYKDREGLDLNAGAVLFKAKGAVIDGWQRISGAFFIPDDATYMKITLRNTEESLNVYFDDVRMHPHDSNMKTFVYDPVTQRLQAELDENNYATFYEYDTEGGLVRVKKETERGVYTIQETRSGNSKLNGTK